MGLKLALGLVGCVLDCRTDNRMHRLRRLDSKVAFQDKGRSALSALRIDADDSFVLAADVVRVDGQIRNVPNGVVGHRRAGSHSLADRVLMASAKGCVNKLAGVRRARMDFHVGKALVGVCQGGNVGQVQLRVNSVAVHVERHDNDVKVSCAFAVTEKSSLDAVRSGKQAHFASGHAFAAVVVGVQAYDDVFAAAYVLAKVFDLVGECVWKSALNGRGKVDDDFVVGRRAPLVLYRFANFDGVFDFGVAKAFGRVLKLDLDSVGVLHAVLDALYAVNRDLLDFFLALVERILALGRRR